MLIALNIVQIVLILFLIAAGNGIREKLDSVTQTAVGPGVSTTLRSSDQDFSQRLDSDETRLRRIIREELAYLVAATSSDSTDAESETLARTRDPEADLNQKALVDQQIEYYRSMGRISDSEMDSLLGEAAKLNPPDRKQLMSKLVRALNAGEISGKLL